jgi:hypothetical protein
MFYPIIKVLDYEGWTTVSNFAPNDWENKDIGAKIIHILWTDGNQWRCRVLTDLAFGKSFVVNTVDLSEEMLQNNLAFLYPSTVKLPAILDTLPSEKNWITHVPAWRATVGIKSPMAQVSYQGEMEPFPEKASLLTFHPFLQFDDFDNYLITINLQNSPSTQSSDLEIFNSSQKMYIDSKHIKRNSATVVPLNDYPFTQSDLPVFINKEISAIPFGFGRTKNGHLLSLEHTHPPASFVLHGNRMAVQSGIKASWFKKLLRNENH